MAELSRRCELCNDQSTVYCPSDSAFLCLACDDKVHSANFLVARHVRLRVCSQCRNLAGKRFSGVGFSAPAMNEVTCESCSPHVDDDGGNCLSSSSSCVSSTCSSVSSTRRKRKNGGGGVTVDMKVEGILVNWCRRMGVDGNRVVKMAVELLNGCVGKMTVLPFRVLIATVFWVAVRICCGGGDVVRVEQISGVPSKLILATESRLARVLKRARSHEDHVEGWAEC